MSTATSGERPLTTLVPITADSRGGPIAGQPVVVEDGSQANAVLADVGQSDPHEASVRFLLACPVATDAPPDRYPAPTDLALAVVERLGLTAGLAENDPSVSFGLAVVEGSDEVGSERVLVVDVSAVDQVGGFDPDEPGLGWVELADRLGRGGFAMVGFDHRALPFVPALTGSLSRADRIEQEGRWFRRRADDTAGRIRLERYRRQVLTDVSRARAAGQPSTDAASVQLDRIEASARRRWRGHRPDEAQRGVGRRADWRHLIDRSSASKIAVTLLGLGPAEDWQWLADDDWAVSVNTELPPDPSPARAVETREATENQHPAAVIVMGQKALQADSGVLDRAATQVSGRGSIVVLVDPLRSSRRLAGHRSVMKLLQGAGSFEVRRFLALPDSQNPKRYVPLDHPGGPAWLAGPTPALAQARLPGSRRLLRNLIQRLAPLAPELLGGVVVVAGPRQPSGHGGDHNVAAHREAAVVITSGFDEGSRTIVLPLGPDGRPLQVMKITARPAYRANADREHRLLTELSARVEPPSLIPTPLDQIDDGEIHAVVESYVGRWTMTDVLNEQPQLKPRVELLTVALNAISQLASTPALGQTDRRPEGWSHDGFDDLIGRWFDQLDGVEGASPTRVALRERLAERSQRMEGQTLRFGVRHFDLGPWNMVLADATAKGAGRTESGQSPVTVVDWELASPRTVAAGPVGADHLYFTKYWLHIAANCQSVEDEQSAFAFLAGTETGWAGAPVHDAVNAARQALGRSVSDLGLATGFMPLLEAHVWAEAACYTSERRRGRGGDGGSPARYLDTLARHRATLLDAWPI